MINFGKQGNLPLDKATVESLVSIVYKIPSYRISDLEISEIFEPKQGTPPVEVILSSINPRDYKDIPGFPTSNVELQMVLQGYILYALIFCRKVKFSRFLKFSFVMICQNVLSNSFDYLNEGLINLKSYWLKLLSQQILNQSNCLLHKGQVFVFKEKLKKRRGFIKM